MSKNSEKKKGRERTKPKREKKRPRAEEPPLGFTMKNYALFAIGIVAIGAGFFTLARGSITLAPILLVLGYCVLIPVAILLR
ncbi:hypothetical protein AMJ71_02925 [candidate division TA06 bacterium SM1_40]|uniref:DUF3098 domain-containing protein n=2 Tax=Bacteria division TA06 TaxID=1156500 RepID=A0A0S8JML6_UNCT6|nr:MAG: hypothetical protein AMJ82_02985 [candidate division TA06 bacterium SM23_40]KPL10483.1 MAG: hypothetical protein AMJ71_02925 [candidate division TA06 bacterium SM1_40]